MAIYQYLTMSFQRAEMYKSKQLTLDFKGARSPFNFDSVDVSEQEKLTKCVGKYGSTSETATDSSEERSKLLSSQQDPADVGSISGVAKS